MTRLEKLLFLAIVVCVLVGGFSPLNFSGDPFAARNAIAAVEPFAGKNRESITIEEAKGIERINQFRTSLGLQPIRKNYDLGKAAQAHSNYGIITRTQSHYETQGKPGFTGVYAWDRTQYYGYGSSYVGEVISFGNLDQTSLHIDNLIDAPYHRLILSDPNMQDVGIGLNHASADSTGSTVIDLGTTNYQNDGAVVVYPYPGQKDAKLVWQDNEFPNPLASYGKSTGCEVGYPITMSLYNSGAQELKTISATLVDSNGNPIAFYQVDSGRETDVNEKLHVFLIPQNPLKPGISYTVEIKAEVISVDGTISQIEKKWSFSTLNKLVLMYIRMQKGWPEIKLKDGDSKDVKIELKSGNTVLYCQKGNSYTFQDKSLVNGQYDLVVSSPLFPQARTYNIRITGPPGSQNIYLSPKGQIDSPASGKGVNGITTISGWCLDGVGVKQVQVLVDGQVYGTAVYGDSRQDMVADYPEYNNDKSGFHYSLDTKKLTDGIHLIISRVSFLDGRVITLPEKSITVCNNPTKGSMDILPGQINGVYTIKGWFLDPCGVAKLELLVDGTVKGQAVYGDPRLDVYNQFPAYNNKNAGFHYVLDTTKLTEGTHKITIRETGRSGVKTILPVRPINISLQPVRILRSFVNTQDDIP